MIARDALLIYAAAFPRAAAVGLVGVILAIALTEAGVSVAGTVSSSAPVSPASPR